MKLLFCKRALLALTILSAATVSGFAKHPKIAQDVDDHDPDATVNVIVQFKQMPTEADHAKVHGKGGTEKARLHGIKAGAYSIPAKALAQLAADPDVLYISPDRKVKGSLDSIGPAVGADVAKSYGYDGTGIAIAVIDSGVTTQDDLKDAGGKSRVVYSQDFVGGGTNDSWGHGTHAAGILGGNGKRSTGSTMYRTFRGIAPNVKIVNLRVLDGNGFGAESNVIKAIDTAVSLKSKYNIRVLNLSLGHPVNESYTLDPLCQAVERAWKAGIVVVVAAGNEGRNNTFGTQGYGTIMSPGNDPYVITVGAMKTMATPSRGDDLIASYSSKGPSLLDHVVKPDLVAPGNRVVSLLAGTAKLDSTYPQNTLEKSQYDSSASNSLSSYYFTMSGTSMATPVVSGAVALMLQKTPSLTPDTVKARLMKSASKGFPASSVAFDAVTGQAYTSQYDIFTVGAGYLRVAATIAQFFTPTYYTQS